MRQLRYCVLALAGMLLAGCQTVGNSSGLGAGPSPERPGTAIDFKNPDPSKWAKLQVRANQGAQPRNPPQIWVCKPMACAGKAAVAVQTAPTPTRNPDKKALEKAAKLLATQLRAQDMMAEVASDGDERITPLSSKVTEVRGYPAIMAETRRTSQGKASYTMRGELFIGAFLVKVISISTERNEAKRHFDAFVTAWEIEDFAPGAQPSAVATPVALDDATPAPASQ